MPPQVYAQQRHTFDRVMAVAIKDGGFFPAAVAKVIVAARAFDRQIRKLNQLAAGH